MKKQNLEAPEFAKNLCSVRQAMLTSSSSQIFKEAQKSYCGKAFLRGMPPFFFQLPYLKIDIVWGRNGSCVPLGWRGGGGKKNGSSGPLATGATWLIPLHATTSTRNEIKTKGECRLLNF